MLSPLFLLFLLPTCALSRMWITVGLAFERQSDYCVTMQCSSLNGDQPPPIPPSEEPTGQELQTLCLSVSVRNGRFLPAFAKNNTDGADERTGRLGMFVQEHHSYPERSNRSQGSALRMNRVRFKFIWSKGPNTPSPLSLLQKRLDQCCHDSGLSSDLLRSAN